MSPRYQRLPALEVEPDEMGRPTLLRWRGTDLSVEVCGQWRVDEPWGRPIRRDYFQLRAVEPPLLLLVFLDRLTGAWHLERLYD